MPLVSLDSLDPDLGTPFAPLRDAAPAEPDVARPGFVDTVTAAFRQDNTLVSTAQYLQDITGFGDDYDRNYSAWDEIKGTPYEDHWSAFVSSNSAAETAMLRERIDRENDDRRTLAAAGLGGVFASMGASILDPSILIPVGGQLKASASGGFSLTRSALSAARAGLVGSAATEAILQGTQETRPLTDSLVTIGTSTVLSGLLGAGSAAFFTRAEEKAAGRALARLIDDGGEGGAPGSVGAAAVNDLTTADLSVAGGAANSVAEATRFISPNQRANFRASARARQFTQELSENTLYQDMHAAGRSTGAAVETAARSRVNSLMLQGMQAHNDLFSNMKKAGINMSRQEFEEAVGRAMRRGDTGDNDFVSQAAQAWRKRVFDPFKDEAIDMGLLPPDVSTDTAASYFSRLWNKERLTAQEPEFKQRVTDYYENIVRQDYEGSVESLAKRQARLEQEIADLRMTPDERVETLNRLKAAGKALDEANPEVVDRVSLINDLRRYAKAADEAGNTNGAKIARDQIAVLEAEGGDALKNYKAERRKLRSRFKRVDLNYAGMTERADKILTAIDDVEERNLRSLARVVQKGRKLEREMARLTPKALASRIEDLRLSFTKLADEAKGAVDRAGKALYDNAGKAQKNPDGAEAFDAATKAKIEKEIARQQARADRLESIALRLETAENFDPTMTMVELKKSVDDLVMEASHTSLERGGKIERLKERLSRLDPKLIDERVKALEAAHKRLGLEHNGRWATKLDVGAGSSRPGTDFTGAVEMVHASYDPNLKGFQTGGPEDGVRYMGNAFGDDVVYLDNAGTWSAGKYSGFSNKHNYKVEVKFRKAFVLSPETAADFKRITGGKDSLAAVRALKAQGYDGLVVQGFDDALSAPHKKFPLNEDGVREYPDDAAFEKATAETDAIAKRFGINDEMLQDQTVVFNPTSVRVLGPSGPGARVEVKAPPVSELSFRQTAREIADDVFNKLTGRNHGDNASANPEYMTPISRAPMKDRTFNVPDELVEDFLEDNVLTVAERYSRTMASEIELTRRFGRADMRDQLDEIKFDYDRIRQQINSAADDAEARKILKGIVGRDVPKTREAMLKFLRDDEKGAVHDLMGVRDLIRGTYMATENASNYGRTVRGLMAFNYIRSMGGALAANLTEVYRPAMVHGLRRYFGQGLAPLVTNMKAVKMSIKEAQLAGQVTERVLQNRMMSLGEIGDPYRQGTAMERLLQNGSRVASKWNGLVYWTDAMKSISSVMSQNRILEGTLKGKDTRLLAYLGIDTRMSKRVAAQFAEHGEVLDGVHVANTEAWTDDEAVRAFRAAVSKDVDSIIVTKSVGDVPLFANTPTGKLLLQFRNYSLAAHQRVTLRAMQEAPHRFVTGIVAMTSLGMLAATLRAWRGGEDSWRKFEESASNPGYLIGEGLDMSGLFALPVEVGNTVEKVQPFGFSFNPIKAPLRAAGKLVNPESSMQGGSVRFSQRGPWGAVLGPSFGLGEDLVTASQLPAAAASGKVTKKQKRSAARVVPFNSYLGLREMLQVVTGDSPYFPADDAGEPAQ